MRKYVRLFFVLLLAIFFSCAIDDGGNQDEIPTSSRLSNPVTLDGQITSPDEWVETNAYIILLDRACCWPDKEVVENAAVMTVRFKNDDLWLYMLYKIVWSPSDIDSKDGAFIELFTAPYGPPWAESDFGVVLFGRETWDAYGWDDTKWYADTDAGGQNDVEGAAYHDGTFYWFEFRKKLDSGDGYDWTLQPPQTAYMMVGIWDDSPIATYEQSFAIQLSE